MPTKAAQAFQRRVYLFGAGLAGLCLVLMLLTWLQGARVRSADIDVVKVTQQGGQRLLLQLNQSPGTIDAKDISITPNASFSATSAGKAVALQFTQPLRNETTYKLQINAGGDSIDYSFTTGASSFFYVVDVPGGSELHERRIGSDTDVVVLASKPIEDYIVLGNAVVYTIRDTTGKTSLHLFNLVKREHKELPLPEDGTVDELRAAPDGRSFGFLFTASDYRSENSYTVVLYDLDKHTSRQVLGFDNKPVKAFGWQFARNSKTIAAVGTDHTLFLINPGSPPIPFGQYDYVEGFSFDDSGLLATDRGASKEIVNLKSGQRDPVPQLDNDSYPASVTLLNTEPGLLFRSLSYQGTEPTDKIIINRGETSKQVYSAEPDKGHVTFSNLSPNDQYIGVELRDAATDTATIEIVDTSSSEVVTKLSGHKIRWMTGTR